MYTINSISYTTNLILRALENLSANFKRLLDEKAPFFPLSFRGPVAVGRDPAPKLQVSDAGVHG